MSHAGNVRCACVADHAPEPADVEVHHIVPLYAGGPDVAANRIPICANAHNNVPPAGLRAGRWHASLGDPETVLTIHKSARCSWVGGAATLRRGLPRCPSCTPRIAWQFAQRTSHLAISARIADQLRVSPLAIPNSLVDGSTWSKWRAAGWAS